MIARYLGLTTNGERALADAFALVALRHAVDPEVRRAAKMYYAWCRARAQALEPAVERYGSVRSVDGERLRRALFRGNRMGGFGLLRDFHDLVTLATSVRGCWSVLHQAACGSRDRDLVEACRGGHTEIDRVIAWLEMKLHQAAPQALTVPSQSTKEMITSLPSLAQVGAVAGIAPTALLRRLVPIAPRPGALVAVLAAALGAMVVRKAGLSRSMLRGGPSRTSVRRRSVNLRKAAVSPILSLVRNASK